MSQKQNGIFMRLLIVNARIVTPEIAFSYLTHDISHTTGRIIEGRNKSNSIVPPFLKHKKSYEFNNAEILKDELYGDLWGSDSEELLTLARNSESATNFIEGYVRGSIEESLEANYQQLQSFAKDKKIVDKKQFTEDMAAKGELVADEIKNSLPEAVIRLLTYIWDHRENPRVLADLFFKEVGPYISELQKRKMYQTEQ